ncbi:coiled-coil domain-containing protein 191 [Aplochiton taeniatus]
MAYSGPNPNIFRWKRLTKCKPSKKVHLNNGDIDQWMKKVEMASEYAVSEVFSLKKPIAEKSRYTIALQNTEQLQDHDEAYSEAQALLSDWMNSKLRLELEIDEEEHGLTGSSERSRVVAEPSTEPVLLNYSNFDDLYTHLADKEESCVVNNFLQNLMERDVLESDIDLTLDSEQNKGRRDPIITMEARHRQVRENRAQRDAKKEQLQRERDARKEAREEAKRKEYEEGQRRRQEKWCQEEKMQQEMVRLRRQMEERRALEQVVRQREKDRLDRLKAARNQESGRSLPTAQQHNNIVEKYRQKQAETKVHLLNLKCLQKHFSRWYSVLLERRVCMGKASALCDWRRQLRTWRAWRALVWAGRAQRETAKTEQELRVENRRCQKAMESDRRRLLRRCLNDWQLWCRTEREQRELLAQQEKTLRKMAALINAAATGKLNTREQVTTEKITSQTETSDQQEQQGHEGSGPVASIPPSASGDRPLGVGVQPTQAWQVTRCHAALTTSERQRARQRSNGGGDSATGCPGSELGGSRFEHRHATQQQTIVEQRRLLKEQQEEILRLKEEQSMIGLKQQAERAAQLTLLAIPAAPRLKRPTSSPKENRALSVPGGNTACCSKPRKPASHPPGPHPTVKAMEERARQRAERRREVEELKRKKEEEKLAQMKAAEEQRQREEDEEKRREAERKKEEKRQVKEREQEKQRQLEREQQLQTRARQHNHRTLLLRRGLVPWKRLVQLNQVNTQLATDHHRWSLLRRCMLSWQEAAGESLAQKEACADQLHQHQLLRSALSRWKKLKDWGELLEGRAERFHRTHTLRRVLTALLDQATQERIAEWERQRQAEVHSDRRALRGSFRTWRQFPRQMREEREREVRRQQLRRRVAEVLPDFRTSSLEFPWERPPL